MRTCAICFCAVMPAHLDDHLLAVHVNEVKSWHSVDNYYVPLPEAEPSRVPSATNTPIREDTEQRPEEPGVRGRPISASPLPEWMVCLWCKRHLRDGTYSSHPLSGVILACAECSCPYAVDLLENANEESWDLIVHRDGFTVERRVDPATGSVDLTVTRSLSWP